MTELTSQSRDVERGLLHAPPGACAQNCPLRVLCNAVSGPRATTRAAADLPAGSVACLVAVAEVRRS